MAILAIPFLLLPIGAKVPGANIVENRILAGKPEFNKVSFSKLPLEYENYLNDNLPFRPYFTANYMRIWEMGFSSFVSENIKGKDNQYFTNSKDGPTIDRYLGLNKFSLPQLYMFRTTIAGRQAFWQAYGASYLFMLLPDKTTLYPEYLPDWIKNNKDNWFDQLGSILENTGIHYLDINEELGKLKNPEAPFCDKIYDVYHWNGNALDAMYKLISKKFENNIDYHKVRVNEAYAVKPQEMWVNSFVKEIVPWIKLESSNLSVYKHNYSGYNNPPWAACDIITNDKLENGTLLFSTDSYFKATHQDSFKGAKGQIFPLAHNVHKFISLHYMEKFSILKKIAQVEKPNIVIEASVERAGLNITMTKFPRLLIAGDRLLNEPQFIITPKFLAQFKNINCILKSTGNTLEVVAKNYDPILILPTQRTNKDGRFVVMVKMASSIATDAQVFYAQGDEQFHVSRVLSQKIKKGINYLHFPIYARPDKKIRLRFDPGWATATYTIFPMPDTKALFEEKL